MADRKAAELTGANGARFAWPAGFATIICAAWLTVPAAFAAEEGGDISISGTISLANEAANALAPDDRLVIKIYHPGDGVDYDPKYVFKSNFELPLRFRIAPPIDMNARPRWPTYIVEAFTDRDRDALTLTDDELFATTGQALTTGTHGVILKLLPVRR